MTNLLLKSGVDYMTSGGAQQLTGFILAYWAKRGKYPQVWIEHDTKREIVVVRSNMTNGHPQ